MISKDDQERIDQWFKDHKATYLKDQYTRIIDWRKPGTSSYGVTYTWQGSYMLVTGDLGVTVFQVPAMSFDFFADCELDYLISKIVASSATHGDRVGYSWDEVSAKEHIMKIAPERRLTREDRTTLRSVRKQLADACYDKQMLLQETERLKDELESLFGYDWYSILPNSYEPSIHVSAQYLGLKMAVAQLQKQGVSIEG